MGGYHRPERREQIAHGLRDTPVFVVHAPRDRRCPLAPEAELWEAMSKLGNRVQVKQNVLGGHCELWKHAYAKDTDLWKWFLAQ